MLLQFVFVFIIGVVIGFGFAYQVIAAIIQYGIDNKKIVFKILDK